MKKEILIILVLLTSLISMHAANLTSPPISIVPRPAQVVPGEGNFTFSSQTLFSVENHEQAVIVRNFINLLKRSSGITSQLAIGGSEKSHVCFTTDSSLKSEAYQLAVTPEQIQVKASDIKGFFYALQTIRLLLPSAVEGNQQAKNIRWSIPAVTIQDEPRFGYRALMLDAARFFIPKENVLRIIDCMGMLKINTLHFHLTDDNGWRLEIKKYPRLTEVGAWRVNRMDVPFYFRRNAEPGEPTPIGGFYTQEDIKEVVAYAKKRFVEIIPEIEMPGHSVAALTAYPEYSCTGGPFEVEGRWGVFNDIYCTKESTFTFMQDILDEVVKLFPSSYIHLGGDEAPRIRWKNCVHCQERMKQEHLTKEAELQTYFINRIENYLNARGKKIIGWDEILEGGIPQRATVMSWRGEKGGIHAAKAGYDVIMSPNIYMYFNCFQFKGNGRKIGNPNRVITLEKVYNYHPVPEALTADEAKHIKGVQANLWTEYMSALDEMEYMLYPRVAALSEVAWSKKEYKDYGKFCTRLESIRQHYDVLGINYCKKISNE